MNGMNKQNMFFLFLAKKITAKKWLMTFMGYCRSSTCEWGGRVGIESLCVCP